MLLLSNLLLFLFLFLIPVGAEYATAIPENVPGIGLAVLLYKPFDFGYVILATVLFLALNVVSLKKTQDRHYFWKGVGVAAIMVPVWFAATFIAVGNLHLKLGGPL